MVKEKNCKIHYNHFAASHGKDPNDWIGVTTGKFGG